MKTISSPIIITSLRAKVDGSLGISFITPELSSVEKAEFMNLQNINLNAVFTPLDNEPTKELKINKDIATKTQAERLRAVLFILWKQNKVELDFDAFYKQETEKIIESVKSKLVEE